MVGDGIRRRRDGGDETEEMRLIKMR